MINVENTLQMFNQIRKVYANMLQERITVEHFTPNEISVLILLSNNKTITTSSALRLVLGVSKGLISRSIDHLQEKGLVICQSDENDRRVMHIHLSEKAKPIIAHIKEEIQKINDEVLSDIKEEDLRHMEETMQHILQSFQRKGIK